MSNEKIKAKYLYNVFSSGKSKNRCVVDCKPKFKDLGKYEKEGWEALAVFFRDNLFNERLK